MPRVTEVNSRAWLDLLASIYRADPSCRGVAAVLSLVQQQLDDTRRMLAELPADAELQRGLQPVRDEVALVSSRMESYDETMRAAIDHLPRTLDDRIACETVYLWLTTGDPPDRGIFPALPMGDAALVASLWNQTVQGAVLNRELNDALPLPFGGTPEGTYAKERVREWLSSAAANVEAFGQDSARAIDDALADVGRLLKDGRDWLATVALWVGAGAGAVLVLYLLLKYARR